MLKVYYGQNGRKNYLIERVVLQASWCGNNDSKTDYVLKINTHADRPMIPVNHINIVMPVVKCEGGSLEEDDTARIDDF
jgi:hypothetical protein